MNIILFEELPLSEDAGGTEEFFIPRDDFRANHILSVLKLKNGDVFSCGVVNKSQGRAEITKIDETGIFFSYTAVSEPVFLPVTLIVAQVRPICMKRILRDAVMIGCRNIILTGAEKTEKSYAESTLYTLGEYKKYLLDGAMQSGKCERSDVFFVKWVKEAIEKASELCTDSEQTLILLDNAEAKASLSTANVGKSAVLAIGPERGWSDRERNMFKTAGYASMLLGERILRTETAVPVGLGLLLSRMGRV